MQDFKEFLVFLRRYFVMRAFGFGRRFEGLKDILVAFLIVKRGRYSSSFLTTSILLLIVTAVVGGPIIAENNPFIDISSGQVDAQQSVISYNPSNNALGTVISAKPRDKIVEYKVEGGDTLESISRKFDVSVDTIKWTNDLKSDEISPGKVLDIPPITGVVHKVSSGETVYSIAKKYNTNAQKIVNFPFNDFADLSTFSLTSGQTLFVPDGVIQQAQPRYIAQQAQGQSAPIQAGVQGSSNFIWPTSGSISQYPVGYHMALDIENRATPPIIASDTGTVTYVGFQPGGYGNHIIIDHGNGYQTLYAHLSSIGVGVGQAVGQGQQIGVMGSTGRSTGTHLHFEIRSGGLLNPLSFLQ